MCMMKVIKKDTQYQPHVLHTLGIFMHIHIPTYTDENLNIQTHMHITEIHIYTHIYVEVCAYAYANQEARRWIIKRESYNLQRSR